MHSEQLQRRIDRLEKRNFRIRVLAFAAVATVGWLQRRDSKLRGEEHS